MEMHTADMFREAVRDEAALRQALTEANTGPMLWCTPSSGRYAALEKAKPFIQGAWPYMQVLPEDLRTELAGELWPP